MPQYSSSQSFLKLFCPPEGYQTDFVAMTTFTLSLRLLVQIPALMECGEKGIKPPHGLGATIRRRAYMEYCNKFCIFYDGNAKAVVDNASFYGTAVGRLAQQLLSTRCTPIAMDHGLFHPKIMLFQFSKAGKKYFRAHISSRNLTLGHMLEAGVTLETVEDSHGENQPAKALAEFFALLQGKKKRSDDNKALGLDLDALGRTTLKICVPPDEKVDCTLYLSGLDRMGGKPCSPSLLSLMQQDHLKYPNLRVLSMAPQFQLFLPKNDQSTEFVCNFQDLYQQAQPQSSDTTKWIPKSSALFPNQHIQSAFVCECTPPKDIACPDRPRSLHIKECLFSAGNSTSGSVWIGSANCSDAALQGGNVEVMVRYQVEKCPMPAFDNRSQFCGTPLLKFHPLKKQDVIDNPELPPDPTDRFISVSVKKVEFEKKPGPSWALTVTLANREEVAVQVWLPHIAPQTLEKKEQQNLSFEITKPSLYSQVLLLQKVDDNLVYALPLNWIWDDQAGTREELIRKVPLDPIESVKDLVPPLYGEDTATDEAYERVLKWAVLHPDTCAEVFEQTLEDCRARLLELECLMPHVPNNRPALLVALGNAPQTSTLNDEDEEELCRRYHSAYSTALFLDQIRELQQLLLQLTDRTKSGREGLSCE